MGKKLVRQLLSAIDKMDWPQNPETTDLGRRAFEVSIDKVDGFKGNPKVLAEALRALQTSDSQPYALAGVAYTLLAAAQGKDDAYAELGLDAAMDWLEKAQAAEPDNVDINVIEALVYVRSGRLDDARLVLDYLQQQDPHSYYLQRAEIEYWRQKNDLEATTAAFEQANELARTVPQRLRLLSQMGDAYLDMGQPEKAVEKYKEAVHFDKENHLLWHKISLIYWQMENYKEAANYNRRALKVKEFPAGKKMEAALKEKMGDQGGVLGRLFGG
jgi:tetratricopeptide (TPR) repeat protein